MFPRFIWPIAALLGLFALSLTATSALAGDDDKSGRITVWTVTDGAETVGFESLRLVHSDSGSFFASGELNIKKGKHKGHRKNHLQRNAEGKVLKYRRVEMGRKGKGVFAFDRNGGLRVVGLNTGGKPTDHGAVLARHVWDPKVWSHLAIAATRLEANKTGVDLSYFDVDAKKGGTATFAAQDNATLYDTKGAVVEVAAWSLQSGPGAPLTLYLGEKQRLIGVKGAARAMLLKGWSWEAAAPAEDAEAAEAAEAAEEAEAGSADDESNTTTDREVREVGP